MTKVLVGLSGGVDSAVAAHLLQKEGYEVWGAFIKIWQPEFINCTWEEDRLSAKRVAAHLGIPFLEFDFSNVYKQTVIADLVEGYAQGRTPNPDVWCNRHIKFGAFWKEAKARGFSYIATGHYARISEGLLARGIDPEKDQSYFLARLTPDDLAHTLLPLGAYHKSAIRQIAKEIGLPNASRPDSQGLCFVGDVSIGDFLSHYVPSTPGEVHTTHGERIGSHLGAVRYTIGQRHGFTLEKEQAPHYVVAIDTKKNILTVSPKRQDSQVHDILLTEELWHKKVSGAVSFELRYHQGVQEGVLEGNTLQSRELQTAASGQVIVFYEGDTVVGSALIA